MTIEAPIRSGTTDVLIELQRAVDRAQALGRPTLVSLSVPVSLGQTPSPIDLFAGAAGLSPNRYLWSPPGGASTLVGLGAAYVIDVVDGRQASRFQTAAVAWRNLLQDALITAPPDLPVVGPLLIGGFSFDADRPTTELWLGYPQGRLVLPRLLYTFLHDSTWLTYNAVVEVGADAEKVATVLETLRTGVLDALRSNGHRREPARPTILQREVRSAAEWQADVARAAGSIRSGKLEKVVLARAVELQATMPFDSAAALRHLAEHYTGCYVFAMAHGGRCFLGATPERLIRLQDSEILTMSLAGSSQRGLTPEEDDRLGEALLDSAKDRYEHAVVVQAMVEALNDVCASLRVSPEPSLLKLGNIQHICTTITGDLANGRTIFDLIESLHPTPAVGGRPREAGLALIRECEKLDRGWYAGPIGWVDRSGEGEFAVALRSALVHNHTATLFAGCGIMADSDPGREFAESILKLKPMLAALGV